LILKIEEKKEFQCQTYHMTSLINFITISFNIRKKCNIGSPRFPIVPIAIPKAQQNVIKPVLCKQKSFVKKK